MLWNPLWKQKIILQWIGSAKRTPSSFYRIWKQNRNAGIRGKMESENNFPADFLSQTHLDYMVDYLELEAQRDAAILAQFLEDR